MVLNRALDDYSRAITPDKPFPAVLGAYINGGFKTVVATNPALTYVRYADGLATTAKHLNRVDLSTSDQNKPIALYYDEYGDLAVWGLDRDQGGAVLQGDPTSGAGGVKRVVAGSNVTVDNTDPTNPVVNSTSGAANPTLLTDIGGAAFGNTTTETTLLVGGALTLPAGLLNVLGTEIEWHFRVLLESAPSGSTDFTIATTIDGTDLDPQTFTPMNSATGIYLDIAVLWIVAATGASGAVLQMTTLMYHDIPNAVTEFRLGVDNAVVDLTAANVLDLRGQYAFADASNNVLALGGYIRALEANP